MSDVYVPKQGDRYHLYEDCSAVASGQQGNTAQGVPIQQAAVTSILAAEAEGKTLCRTCLDVAQRR